jgi:hypothetical protein
MSTHFLFMFKARLIFPSPNCAKVRSNSSSMSYICFWICTVLSNCKQCKYLILLFRHVCIFLSKSWLGFRTPEDVNNPLVMTQQHLGHFLPSKFTNDPLLMFQKPLGHCPVQIKSPATRYARKRVQSGFRAGPEAGSERVHVGSEAGSEIQQKWQEIQYLSYQIDLHRPEYTNDLLLMSLWPADYFLLCTPTTCTRIHQWPAFDELATCGSYPTSLFK